MATDSDADSEDSGPVRIPIEDDDDPVEEATDGGRSIGLLMLALAALAFVAVYLVARGGDDEEAEPPF
ncbi:hypothetical protein [Halogeometricum sp. CBA1124]|uniref:hypothetical protein n=1 Tax=Halogeometricum sp. CBA1124 TaxID=2668071 RepID=UPI00142A930C|nr:hypothetical protein [Halogeometricum sp. CBA1124]MUV58956.1 hypothetical protein [Halogeometricum sp. CBA1124]